MPPPKSMRQRIAERVKTNPNASGNLVEFGVIWGD